jgi:spore maturation protein CgeB
MLRVLVVLPFYGGSLPIGRYCLEALREIGCLAESFEAPAFYSAFSALKELRVGDSRLENLREDFLRVVSQCILAKVEAFAPDLVLCLAQAPLGRAALQRLRRDGVPTAMWFVEDFRLFTYWRAFAPWYDIFAVIQKDPFPEELAAIGVRNVLYLPLAALPSLHRPLELTPAESKEFGAELSFMGAGYPNRRRAFLRFAAQEFKIWGTEWEDEPLLRAHVQRQGSRISPEDCVRIYNATAVNINLHSSVSTRNMVSGGDFVNPRTFELAACGAFQLVDRRGLLPELFAEDELAVFDSLEELEEKCRYYKNRPEERRAFAVRARARVLAEHTYARRMHCLLDFVRERIPAFGRRKPEAWPDDMPEGMRREISQLLETLHMNADAGFDDVITALRAKSGRLSDVETALLFLDEWKKLYAS